MTGCSESLELRHEHVKMLQRQEVLEYARSRVLLRFLMDAERDLKGSQHRVEDTVIKITTCSLHCFEKRA